MALISHSGARESVTYSKSKHSILLPLSPFLEIRSLEMESVNSSQLDHKSLIIIIIIIRKKIAINLFMGILLSSQFLTFTEQMKDF